MLNISDATAAVFIVGLAIVAWGIAAAVALILRHRDEKFRRVRRYRG